MRRDDAAAPTPAANRADASTADRRVNIATRPLFHHDSRIGYSRSQHLVQHGLSLLHGREWPDGDTLVCPRSPWALTMCKPGPAARAVWRRVGDGVAIRRQHLQANPRHAECGKIEHQGLPTARSAFRSSRAGGIRYRLPGSIENVGRICQGEPWQASSPAPRRVPAASRCRRGTRATPSRAFNAPCSQAAIGECRSWPMCSATT